MAKALTQAALDKIKPGSARREVPDGLLTGLYFVVQPTGKRSWAVRYRAAGKTRKLTLGAYPALDLKTARAEASQALRLVQAGDDPAEARQVEKKRAQDAEAVNRFLFERIARQFLTRYAKPKNRSWKETARLLGLVPAKGHDSEDPAHFVVVPGSIVARWGQRHIGKIARAEIIELLDETVDRGAPILANRTLAMLRKLFNWSMERDLVQANPCDRVKPPAAEESRDRVLSDDEVVALWTSADEMGWPFGRLFQILLLTGQRRDEVGSMAWREIDLEASTWNIPRERVKNATTHDVPLNSPAAAILKTLHRIDGRGLVFTTNGTKPVSGFSRAKTALDARMLAKLKEIAKERGEDPEAVTLPGWRLHDIRRTVASGMARIGISIAVIEKILNHTSGTFAGVVGVYQRHEFFDEKRRALVAWGNFVNAPVENHREQNVISGSRLT